ncbi:MAG: DUF2865 domain-containing protein [Hyphomicrobium sp.]
MRNWTALLWGAAAIVVAVADAPGAHAQSVFQKIFGFGGAPGSSSADQPRARQIIPSHRFQSRAAQRAYQSRATNSGGEDDEVGPPDSGGPYKTMCVRSCDGYYFPLRHNARRKNFASDAKSCRNACGTDARLFYYSLRGPEGPDAMVDLSGKKYSELPHAFAYRKALVQGCTCKPVPWSYEEASRHQSYADQEAIELAKDLAFLEAQQAAKVEADAKSNGAAVAQSQPEAEPASETGNSGAATVDDQAADPAASPADIDVAAAVHKSIATNDDGQSTVAKSDAAAPSARTGIAQALLQPLPRAGRRRAKSGVQRASFKPASSGSWFGGKSKYVWPGDAR